MCIPVLGFKEKAEFSGFEAVSLRVDKLPFPDSRFASDGASAERRPALAADEPSRQRFQRDSLETCLSSAYLPENDASFK